VLPSKQSQSPFPRNFFNELHHIGCDVSASFLNFVCLKTSKKSGASAMWAFMAIVGPAASLLLHTRSSNTYYPSPFFPEGPSDFNVTAVPVLLVDLWSPTLDRGKVLPSTINHILSLLSGGRNDWRAHRRRSTWGMARRLCASCTGLNSSVVLKILRRKWGSWA